MAAFKFNNQMALLVTGCTLVALTLASAGLGLAGIWGVVDEDTGWKLFASFVVTALTVGAVTKTADKFFIGGKG
jgi:hypothetical protein